MYLKPTDLAIDPRAPYAHDAFNRKDVVEDLIHLLGNLSGPFVIAIDSPWGTGKTTFLKILKARLEQETFACLYFNAWETDFADDPLVAFMGETDQLIREIAPAEAERLKHLDKAKRIASAVAKRTIPAAIKAVTLGALDLDGELEKIAADAVEGVALDAVAGYLKEKDLIGAFRQQLDEALLCAQENGRKLPFVVFVDELDRCRPAYAIELLERIKHVFNVSNAVFVLAIDKRQLGISLGAVYGQAFDSKEYLRRFFDLEFQLAQVDSRKFCDSLIQRMNLEEFFANRPNSARREEASRFRRAFLYLSALFNLTPRAQEHYMSLLAMAMLTTPPTVYFPVEPISALAALRIADSDMYDRVCRRGSTITEVTELIRTRARPIQGDSQFHLVIIGSLLAVRNHRDEVAERYRKALIDRARQASKENQSDEEADLILRIGQDSEYQTVRLQSIVKRIDRAAQFADSPDW